MQHDADMYYTDHFLCKFAYTRSLGSSPEVLVALITQHIITSSVFKLGSSSLTMYFNNYSARKL
jgi:hypothetical protein